MRGFLFAKGVCVNYNQSYQNEILVSAATKFNCRLCKNGFDTGRFFQIHIK
jgi:hypothetical protein